MNLIRIFIHFIIKNNLLFNKINLFFYKKNKSFFEWIHKIFFTILFLCSFIFTQKKSIFNTLLKFKKRKKLKNHIQRKLYFILI